MHAAETRSVKFRDKILISIPFFNLFAVDFIVYLESMFNKTCRRLIPSCFFFQHTVREKKLKEYFTWLKVVFVLILYPP